MFKVMETAVLAYYTFAALYGGVNIKQGDGSKFKITQRLYDTSTGLV
jgi:hypothetical protein